MSTNTYSNPGPWAVTAFSTTSFMLGIINAGIISGGCTPVVLDVAIFFGGIMQIIVAILEFMKGNTLTTTVFGTYGPFWLMFAMFELFFAKSIPPSSIGSAVSLFLAMFAVITFYFFIASLKTDKVLVVIFALVFIALVLLSVGAATGNKSLDVVAGWLIMIFAVLGWYHAAAAIINSTWGREVLGVGSLKPKQSSISAK
ncbi:acetate uptake transporter [Desulfosporosinus sp. PR]|uniref:acetate uptake transporter n=1 Tax=Candidatus Desulfosporosinus nitrosoreducens TaxID=3401928 RepID=UPI0027E6276F|nr:acetate uptake transporter [Desulfosporosinus sp. PR]MDQ7092400.1 acetate uptake transporter [Desulfosporosinus sp. PR]